MNEKVKRDGKSNRRLFISAAGVLSLAMVAGLVWLFTYNPPACGCSDMTRPAIETSNAIVAAQLTQTVLAALITRKSTDDAATSRTPLSPTQCGTFWSTRTHPEGTQMLQLALNEAGLDAVTGQVLIDNEYERCEVFGLGTPVALDGRVHLQFTVVTGTAETPEARGALLEHLLTSFNPLDYRGAEYILVAFGPSGTPGTRWYMTFGDAYTALKNGVHGTDLYEAGDY